MPQPYLPSQTIDPTDRVEPVPRPNTRPVVLVAHPLVVSRFQKQHGLPITGHVDYRTWFTAGQMNITFRGY